MSMTHGALMSYEDLLAYVLFAEHDVRLYYIFGVLCAKIGNNG